MDKQNTDDITLSEEERLLFGNESTAKTSIAGSTKIKQTAKNNRHRLVDSNRLRAHSMGDISRLTQSTLQMAFGKTSTGANTKSTLTVTNKCEPAIPHIEPIATDRPDSDAAISSTLTGISQQTAKAQTNPSSKNDVQLHGNENVSEGATNTSTSHTVQPATLNDVKKILESNKFLGNLATENTQPCILRPPLNSNSTPNGGAVRKKRRGGKKYKEMLAKRAERAAAEQNTTTANLPAQNPNASTPMQRGNKGAHSNTNTNKGWQKSKAPNNAKRGRVTGETPPDAIQTKKKQMHTHNANTPTTSKANFTLANAVIEANLVVAVYDSPAENIILPLSKEKYQQLYASINELLFSDIEKCSVIPTFTENKHVRGVMKVKCATPGAKSWLIDAIKRTTSLWQNMKLKTVDFNKLPRQNRVLGLFPHCKLNAEQIRRMLSATNPHINVGCWTILSSKTTDKGAHVAFGIDELQLEMLKACRFKLYFGAGSALFKDISKKQGEARKMRDNEMDLDTENTDLNTNDESDDDDDDVTITISNVNNTKSAAKKGRAANLNAQTNKNSGAEIAANHTAAPKNVNADTNVAKQGQATKSNAQTPSVVDAATAATPNAAPNATQPNTNMQNKTTANGDTKSISEMEIDTTTDNGAK